MKKDIILYGLSEEFEDIYYAMKSCYNILGVAERNPVAGKCIAEKLGIKYIEPKDVSQMSYHAIYVTSKTGYPSIFRDLVYKYGAQREAIFLYTDFFREISLSLGTLNPDKTIYVIRWPYCKSGIFAIFIAILNAMLDLPEHYVIYFDFINYRNVYMKESETGKINAFEKWFKQPSGLSAEEVYSSKHVVLAPCSEDYALGRDISVKTDKKYLEKCAQTIRKYIKPNEKFAKLLAEERKKIFCSKEKICAVIFRGTDYLVAKAYKHPIQPELDQLIKQVRIAQEQWDFMKIYLVTEDQKGQERFVEEFGDAVVFSERQMIDDYPVLPAESAIVNIQFDREDDEYLKGMEYLRQVIIASECDFIISGQNSSYRGALALSGGFERCYEFDLGLYGIDDDSYCTPWGHYILLEEERKVEAQRKMRNKI